MSIANEWWDCFCDEFSSSFETEIFDDWFGLCWTKYNAPALLESTIINGYTHINDPELYRLCPDEKSYS